MHPRRGNYGRIYLFNVLYKIRRRKTNILVVPAVVILDVLVVIHVGLLPSKPPCVGWYNRCRCVVRSSGWCL